MTRRPTTAPLSLLGLLAGLTLLPGCSDSLTTPSDGQNVISGAPEVFPGTDGASSGSQSGSVGQSQSQSRSHSQSWSL